MLQFHPMRLEASGQRIGFWGAPSHFAPVAAWRDNLARTGANTGNLFIGNGLFENVNCATKGYGIDFEKTDPERLHERFDQIFVPASNFLNAASDFASAYEFLSKTKLPLFCFGLGSQHLPGRDLVLKPGTERFIRLLSERSGMVGVRGRYTAELLNKMGIKNVFVVGCPSLLSMSSAAADRLQVERVSTEKVGVHFSNNVRSHALSPASLRDTENSVMAWAITENSFYTIQNEIEEFQLVAAAQSGDETAVVKSLQALASTFGITLPNLAFENFMRHRIRFFFDVPGWISAMRSMSMCIGSRFHGTVGGLLAGTPSILLAHDMRTVEMAELFGIPHVVVDRVYSCAELKERLTSADFAAFVSRLSVIQVEWKYFARANGLDLVEAAAA